MRRINLMCLLMFLVFLGAMDLCFAQRQSLGPEVSRWEIDVESGQFWPISTDRDFYHHRFEEHRGHQIPISLPEGRVLKAEEVSLITGIIKNDFLVNDDTTGGYQFSPAVAMDSGGNFVISWCDERNDYGDIYAQRYSSTGDALGANFRVNDDVGSSSQWSPSVAMDGDGDFVICWYDRRNGDSDIYAQRYSSTGNTLGANYLVNQRPDVINPDQWYPSVALSDDRITFAWMDARRSKGWDIYAKLVTWDWEKVDEPGDKDLGLPMDFALSQNYPNPFNSTTAIGYQRSGRLTLTLQSTTLLGKR